METTAAGLGQVHALTPGRGYLETVAALSRLSGPTLSSELGWRINQQHSLFARGYANMQDQGIGVGWKWEW